MSDATHETEFIDKLFLELSQFTQAKTSKEVFLENALKKANEVLRSAYAIASRKGECVAWDNFMKQLEKILVMQHEIMYGHSDFKEDERFPQC